MALHPKKPQCVLVTGGAGFIGSETVRLLLSQNKQVTVLDNLSSGRLENLPLNHPNLELIEGDILDYYYLKELIKKTDAILHLAAFISVSKSINDPIYSHQVNTQGFLHVLQAIHESKKSIRLIYASSAAVYGDEPVLPCREDAPICSLPISPYGLQKYHNEHYAELYRRIYGVPSLGLRYFNVYGPKQDPGSDYAGVISRFLSAYRKQKELIIYGDGKQSRDFIYVDDVAAANLLALHSDAAGILNIGTGQPQDLLSLIEALERQGGSPPLIHHEPPRPGDIRASYADPNLAQKTIGFKAQTSLSEGIGLMGLNFNV